MLAQRDSMLLEWIDVNHRPLQIDKQVYKNWRPEYGQAIFQNDLHSIPFVVAKGSDTLRCSFPKRLQRALQFQLGDSSLNLQRYNVNKDTFEIILPWFNNDTTLVARYKGNVCGKIRIVRYQQITKKLIIVPMTNVKINGDSLQQYLNYVYGQAGVSFEVHIAKYYNPVDQKIKLLSNPGDDRTKYTEEMISIRNDYFERHPTSEEYYLFVVEGFINKQIDGYMVRNKGFGFVKEAAPDFYRTIAQELGYGAGALESSWSNKGPKKGTTDNLMDVGEGIRLVHFQWELIRENIKTVKYFDEYEQVKTNSGLIAFYVWEEDKEGNIILAGSDGTKAIKHPIKRNLYSYHLNIDNWLFIPLFSLLNYQINALHLICVILFLITSTYVRKRINNWVIQRFSTFRPLRWTIRISSLFAYIFACYLAFVLINRGYRLFEVKEGPIDEYLGMNIEQVQRNLRQNINPINKTEESGSEILVKRGEEWIMKKEKMVLYFEVKKDQFGKWGALKFVRSSDMLEVKLQNQVYRKKAKNHYYVFKFLKEDGSEEYERLFNHWGNELSGKIVLPDPAQRILLFVNGYRPTSIGSTFEENFEDIKNNGLEFPNSNNMIFNFDRYDYWNRWNEMDTRFKQRINPAEVYYADGHFSVSTSNHRSLIHFSRLANNYPKRCEAGNHVCQVSKVNDWDFFSSGRDVPTANLLSTNSNTEGFEIRRRNGQIAGRNFVMMLNELPNRSLNDTIYIVAHSMGYAYSLGMIEELRGKINFGGFYIIAPENAEAGEVKMQDWKEVWQYGGNHELHKVKEPCLLDGIAAQTKAKGLTGDRRVFIPEKYYNRMGFYDSHFIGYYTWIFDVPKGDKGYVEQR